VKSWGFAVPALHIVGSADTREDAREEAVAAIAFALEAAADLVTPVPGAEIEVLDLMVRRSTAA
jgi:predicted RNase H-like HicB family nuclease